MILLVSIRAHVELAADGAHRGIGICTCAGMLASTFIGILFVPALYCIVKRIREALTESAGLTPGESV